MKFFIIILVLIYCILTPVFGESLSPETDLTNYGITDLNKNNLINIVSNITNNTYLRISALRVLAKKLDDEKIKSFFRNLLKSKIIPMESKKNNLHNNKIYYQ